MLGLPSTSTSTLTRNTKISLVLFLRDWKSGKKCTTKITRTTLKLGVEFFGDLVKENERKGEKIRQENGICLWIHRHSSLFGRVRESVYSVLVRESFGKLHLQPCVRQLCTDIWRFRNKHKMNEKKQHNEKYLYDENVETAEKVNAKDYVMSSQNTYTQKQKHMGTKNTFRCSIWRLSPRKSESSEIAHGE